jgi:hypothetical protein
MGSNSGLRGKRPATNRLNRGSITDGTAVLNMADYVTGTVTGSAVCSFYRQCCLFLVPSMTIHSGGQKLENHNFEYL